jgi:type II secretory pathway component HofQ
MNIAVHPGVQGTVSLELRDVHWDQALDVILKLSGHTYTVDGGVLMVMPGR